MEMTSLLAFLLMGLERLGQQFSAGELDKGSFLAGAFGLLSTAHYRAASLGVAQANCAAFAIDCGRLARDTAKEQKRFLVAFVTDIQAGRYAPKDEGGLGARARRVRFGLYAKRLYGTANAAWLRAIALQDTEIRWVLGSAAEHCKTCLTESLKGWRSPRGLMRVPGDGTTQCLVNCGCWLEATNGVRSFGLRGK